ncbi:MAG: hypothetical protein J6U87_00150 [Clostridia bacterium]|nr:hypothetical protein [Clostridia bacterium]
MEAKVGIKKEIDALGRLEIPKEIRDRYHLGKEVEIILTPQGVLIRSPQFELVKK